MANKRIRKNEVIVTSTLGKKIIYPFKLLLNSLISLFLFIKIRPKYIVTTGAHTAGPMCCIGKKTCSVCAGARPYEMDMVNVGINFAAVPNTFVNAGMKKFHTSRVKLSSIDQNKLFI